MRLALADNAESTKARQREAARRKIQTRDLANTALLISQGGNGAHAPHGNQATHLALEA